MFDGDIINMIAIIDPAIKYMFRNYDPIRKMIVARDTGLLNPYFTVEKSQKAVLYDFATCGALENDTPETFPPKGQELQQQEWEKPVHVPEKRKLKYHMTEEEQVFVRDGYEDFLTDPYADMVKERSEEIIKESKKRKVKKE